LPQEPQTVMKAAEVLKASTQVPLVITVYNFYHVTKTANDKIA